jgi:hypothetical protein
MSKKTKKITIQRRKEGKKESWKEGKPGIMLYVD